MRLSTKFTLWYFGIMLVVLLIGGGIVYFEIQQKLTRVEVARHERLNDLIAEQVRRGGDYTADPTRKRATVSLIPATRSQKGSVRSIPVVWNGTRSFGPTSTACWSPPSIRLTECIIA